jgi:two-component system, cell cycle sensor histidine kinase and response regulator CckA
MLFDRPVKNQIQILHFGNPSSFVWEYPMRVVKESDKSKICSELPDNRLGEPRVASVSTMKDWRRGEEKKQKHESHPRTDHPMEALGTLAGGIAHQFNNALFGILGNIELLKLDFPDDVVLDKYVKSMESAVRRMTHLTGRLLAYARGGKYEPETFSLRDFLVENLPSLLHDMPPMIRAETDLEGDMTLVNADRNQIRIVLSVLLNNSVEAIEGPGYIRILMRNEELVEPGHILPPGPYISLIVEDDGKGMDEKTRDRIFEPFFTTKFHGRGLGMAAVYGIVRNHDGWISVDSKPGLGTAVRVSLPVLKDPE